MADASADGADKKPIESAHYAWAEEMKKRGEELSRLGVDSTPKAIEETEAASAELGKVGSAWNAGGTWEDRDTSEWLKTELKAKLLAHSEPITLGSADGVFRFTSVDTCDGTASVVYVRQKAKPGFELKVKIGFAVTSADAKTLATGTVAGEELCDYDGYEFDLTSSATAHADGGLAASAVRPAGATAKAALTACLKECVSRMGVPTA